MKTLLCLCFIMVDALSSYPYNGYRSPQRAVMFGGYYGHPLDNNRGYHPQGSMTFASGDTIATNSFAGDGASLEPEETTEKRKAYTEELEAETSTPNGKRIPKEEREEEEDEGSSWPFPTKNNGIPSYNAFFPIMIGGGGLSGSGRKAGGGPSSDSFYPGSATAIANSFSTGKGGVATSHATSFGDPYLSTMFRNGGYFNKKEAQPQ